MHLPPDTPRSRLYWSALPGAIIWLWLIGVLGASVTLPGVTYHFHEVVADVAGGCPPEAFWPGQFAVNFGGGWFQVAPLLALLLWPLCLIPWRRRRARIASVLAALLVPGAPIFGAPLDLVAGPFWGLDMFVNPATGKHYQDGDLAAAGGALWCWVLVPLAILTIRPSGGGPDECRQCGYSLVGLTGAACPECGHAAIADDQG